MNWKILPKHLPLHLHLPLVSLLSRYMVCFNLNCLSPSVSPTVRCFLLNFLAMFQENSVCHVLSTSYYSYLPTTYNNPHFPMSSLYFLMLYLQQPSLPGSHSLFLFLLF
uniref:Uncharacterized protein n=1 Tax=Cacopsylla melanoneura TaxID=428564 RepID=A0A8D8SM42_9HEMI